LPWKWHNSIENFVISIESRFFLYLLSKKIVAGRRERKREVSFAVRSLGVTYPGEHFSQSICYPPLN